ncbi:MAG: response regulator [Candidatus Nitronauta litoralis]|uniref:Response regulator n=1 Tax=Candidatus Nitronauta litoralis TaxID=2705533 RepID=A0A7T0G1L4_9BACT|nr:MAG: response regulator [Candidatus Nitronauta litoralis]
MNNQTIKILVVDDDSFVRDILADILESSGYLVVTAENGQEGINLINSESGLDVIISDIHMPVLDGLGLIRKLRTEENSEIPIIVLSGNNEVAVAIEAINLGANDYLLKDENLQDTVLLSIEQVLEKKRIVDQNRQLLLDITKKNQELGTIVETMTEIGLAVSSEKNFPSLMEIIITHGRSLTNADAGTLYLVENGKLEFKIVQNRTLNVFLGGKSGGKIEFPPLDIRESNVSGYVAINKKPVNIPDVYESELFDFTGPKNFDRTSNYRSQSMLVVPMVDRFNEVQGVLQLLNATDLSTGKIIPFSDSHLEVVQSLASQAAVALNNLRLEEKTERLLEEVLNIKNYNENVLESLTNGVITLDSDYRIITANAAAQRILDLKLEQLISRKLDDFCSGPNHWILDKVDGVVKSRRPSIVMDAEITLEEDKRVPMNLTFVPLKNFKQQLIGTMLVLEDITTEKRVKGTLARYMTKELADKLLEGGQSMLGGQIQEASILFSDIRDFTTITEKLGAKETVTMLNEYFTVMVDQIFQCNGILDKYIGDAILAVFGAPFKSGQDADFAVKAAINMVNSLEGLNKSRVELGKDPIAMGIGINTDEVLSGNIGSEKRMDYTCIGDGVNLASRLEGLNKYFGTNILISENTFRKLKENYRTRKLDWIKVKGKTKPVIIYEVLGFYDNNSSLRLDESFGVFQEGLGLYQSRDWQGAIRCFMRASEINPQDRAAIVYRERSEFFQNNPPAFDWDGAWEMRSK